MEFTPLGFTFYGFFCSFNERNTYRIGGGWAQRNEVAAEPNNMVMKLNAYKHHWGSKETHYSLSSASHVLAPAV